MCTASGNACRAARPCSSFLRRIHRRIAGGLLGGSPAGAQRAAAATSRYRTVTAGRRAGQSAPLQAGYCRVDVNARRRPRESSEDAGAGDADRDADRKEGETMRYLVAMLALGIGITASVPAVHAGENNGGDVCSVNGAAQSCVQPAPLTLITGPEAGSLAGPAPALPPNAIPFWGGDRGN
jgi:hypothetical protein